MRVKGLDEIAAIFGVTTKTIREWQDAGMPVAVQGTFGGNAAPNEYELTDCINWRIAREVKAQPESPHDRLRRAQAEAQEMKNRVELGQLIPAEELEPRLSAAVISVREMLRNEPPRLARLVVGKDAAAIEAALAAAFDEFLTRLSKWQDVPVEDGEDS